MKRLMDDTYRQFVSKAAAGPEDALRGSSRSSPAAASTPAGRPRSSAWSTSSARSTTPSPRPRTWPGSPTTQTTEFLILPKAQGFLEALVGPLEDRDVFTPRPSDRRHPRGRPARPGPARRLPADLPREPVAVMLPYDLRVH